MAKRPVNYEQADPRWRHYLYDINSADGLDYLSGAGCGPTCAAMVVATYVDPTVTPLEMADWSIAHGHRTKTNGTAWSLFSGVAEEYKLTFQQTYSHKAALACIAEGGIVVCIMGPGLWTKGGHYILWYDYDGSYIYINDPASTALKREKAQLDELQAEVRCYFCYWPPEEKDDDMTQDQFNQMMDTYLAQLAEQEPSEWSAEARAWAEQNGAIAGDESGNKKYKAFTTREQMVQFLYRVKR